MVVVAVAAAVVAVVPEVVVLAAPLPTTFVTIIQKESNKSGGKLSFSSCEMHLLMVFGQENDLEGMPSPRSLTQYLVA